MVSLSETIDELVMKWDGKDDVFFYVLITPFNVSQVFFWYHFYVY